ncbi:MAG TPA: purine-nucleoside phosphorylase [Gemmatimonadales bacterium]|nr:purine-nucleoside phosphorylase [Gemmatimonadales bacterium]
MSERDRIAAAAGAIGGRLGTRRPEVAIVLGSGLGGLAERIGDPVRMGYGEVPGFPRPTVEGHGGKLIAGALAGHTVLAQSGRFHMYEGHEASVCALPVRVFAALGISTLIVTNAAGGIRRTFSPGTLMLIADHINLTFRNPLIGPVVGSESRFPDMSDPYDPTLRTGALAVARERGLALDTGVYAGVLGPSYETPAEIRMLERLGADAVGMSTVIEVIAARASGVRCLGISTITNAAAGITGAKLSHEEVTAAAQRVKEALGALIEGIVGGL